VSRETGARPDFCSCVLWSIGVSFLERCLELEGEVLFGCSEAGQIHLQGDREVLVPGFFFAGFGKDVAVFDHVGWGEIAEIDPDVVGLDVGDLTDRVHDAQDDGFALRLGSSGPDIAPDPDVIRCPVAAEKAFGSLFLFDNDLDEVGRRAGFFAVDAGDRLGDGAFLASGSGARWQRANVGWHEAYLLCVVGLATWFQIA
jgi:hypothetical protein